MIRRVKKYERARHPSGTETKAYVIWNYLMQHGGSKRRELCDSIGIPTNTPLTQFIRAGMINLDNGFYTANPDFDFDDLPASARREVMPQQNDVIDDVVVDQNVEPEEVDIEDEVEIMPDDDIPEPMPVRKPQTKRSAWDDYDDFILSSSELDEVEARKLCKQLKQKLLNEIDDKVNFVFEALKFLYNNINGHRQLRAFNNTTKIGNVYKFLTLYRFILDIEKIINNPEKFISFEKNFKNIIPEEDLEPIEELIQGDRTTPLKEVIEDVLDYLKNKLESIDYNGITFHHETNTTFPRLNRVYRNIKDCFIATIPLNRLGLHKSDSDGFNFSSISDHVGLDKFATFKVYIQKNNLYVEIWSGDLKY